MQTNRLTIRQISIQTDRHTEGQKYKQTDTKLE